MPSKPPRRQTTRNQTRVINRRITNLTNAVNGVQRQPRSDPPKYTVNPWNTLTLYLSSTRTTDVSTSVAINAGNTISALRQQLNMLDAEPIEIRYQEISVWDETDNLGGNQLGLQAFDLINNTVGTPAVRPLSAQVDNPGKNQWARLKYIWPKSHQEVIYDPVNAANDVATLNLNGVGRAKIYIRLLWRVTPEETVTPFIEFDQLKHVEISRETLPMGPITYPEHRAVPVGPSRPGVTPISGTGRVVSAC